MKQGTIVCDCGQEFYFETVRKNISCIRCGKSYDTTSYPVKNELMEEAETD